LIETTEETSGPITLVGKDHVAFLIGTGATQSIAIATLQDRRIVHRITVPDAASIVQLAAAADGKTIYYINQNVLWEVGFNGETPRKIAPANSVAIHPNGREIVVQRGGPNLSVRLVRIHLPEGDEEEIAIRGDVRMGDVPLAANAINTDGKILLTTALDSTTWYWQVSVLDPTTGEAKRVPTDFAGDITYAGWTADGQILATGLNTEGSIWRFRRERSRNN
jgi:hypothetical protein